MLYAVARVEKNGVVSAVKNRTAVDLPLPHLAATTRRTIATPSSSSWLSFGSIHKTCWLFAPIAIVKAESDGEISLLWNSAAYKI